MKFFILVLLFVFMGCQPKKEDSIIKKYGPLCGLFNGSSDIMLCIEYAKGTSLSTVDTYCTNERSNYSAYGATSTAVTESGSIYCDTDNVAGKCTLSGRVISYYNNEFASGQAQSDCTSLGGTYQ